MSRAPLSAVVVVALAALVVPLLGASACASIVLTPGAYDLDRVALVSLHARREIGVQSTELSPVLLDSGLGDEVVEMTVADTEGALEEMFGDDAVVPAGKAMQSKKYDLVTEALPAEDWSQVNQMLAVDIDDAATPAALGALARDLGVDAAVVLRHEWWLQRDRLPAGSAAGGTSTWAYDRCTVLMVDDDGVVVWKQTVVSRAPSRAMFASSFQVGFNGATWADEARQLARETSRLAWAELRNRHAQGPAQTETTTTTTTPTKKKPPAPNTPPPPLEPPPPPPPTESTTPPTDSTTTSPTTEPS